MCCSHIALNNYIFCLYMLTFSAHLNPEVHNIPHCFIMLSRIFNDKAFFFLTTKKHYGQLFNFRIFIKLFIHGVKKTTKVWVLGLNLFNKYQ